jgi:hypothetical protein
MDVFSRPLRRALTLALVLAALPATAAAQSEPPPRPSPERLNLSVAGEGTISGAGASCSTTCSASVPYVVEERCIHKPTGDICNWFTDPQDVRVSAAPSRGWSFAGWAGDCTGTGTCTVTMSNTRTVSASFTNPAPTVTLSALGSTVTGDVGLNAKASDNVGGVRVEYHVDGAKAAESADAPFAFIWNSASVPDGEHTIVARAVDITGKTTDSAAAKVTVDNAPPAVAIGDGPADQTFGPGSTQTWTFAASDAGTGLAAVECSVDGGPFGGCSTAASHTVSGLAEGAHSFTVRATDGLGRQTSAGRAFAIDATAPETSITGGPAEGSTDTATGVSFAFAATEPGSRFECRVYPAALTPLPFAPCTDVSGHTANGFSPGTYSFEVRAIDPVGNIDPSPSKRTFALTAAGHETTTKPGGGGGQTKGTVAGPAGSVSFRYGYQVKFRGKRSRFTEFTLMQLKPTNARIEVSCSGKGCPSRPAISGRGAQRTLKGVLRRDLGPGARVTVKVTSPGMTGRVLTVSVRAKKMPTEQVLCLPAGAAKPGPCT